ncbi:hypothetical protein [Bauldia sp.]|uniref:hypothetical protein n=1 Tax=Bauldia sp. TaxID=2575872 RepID=UPI003BA93728
MTRDLFDTAPARALSRRVRPPGPITLAELERARELVAKIITMFPNGDTYLPIFKRLDAECIAAREKDDVIGRVRRIAAGRAA